MHLTRFIKIQLAIFTVLALVAITIMGVYFMRLPAMVGVGQYTVKIDLPTTGGLYKTSNVTYRGVTVGRVESVDLAATGVRARIAVNSDVKIPKSATANVHSRSAIGEQYVDFVADSESSPYLSDGSVVPIGQTSIPQDVAPMLDTVDRALASLPQGNLKTVIDEGYNAFAGSGPQISQLITSASELLRDANGNVAPTVKLIKDAETLLDSQLVSSDEIRSWAKNLNTLTAQTQANDTQVRRLLDTGPSAAQQIGGLFQDLEPTLPALLANLTSLGQVAVTYNASLEQVLVLLPQMMSAMQTIGLPNQGGTDRGYLSFNLNVNNSPPCTTGFISPEERRDGSAVDSPPRPDEALYCAVPQNSETDVRGARNLPCMDNPGRRAPTVELCNSPGGYQSQGGNPWVNKPAAAGAPKGPVASGFYDTGTGRYRSGDGTEYIIAPSTVTENGGGDQAWQSLMVR